MDCSHQFSKVLISAFGLVLTLSLAVSGALASETIRVCATCEFKSIQVAINHASAGDVIRIASGIYRENSIKIEKPLSIEGEGKPVVDAEGKGDVFVVKADHVSISGLAIRNSGFSYVNDLAGIKIEDSAYCIISGNELIDNFFSIHIAHSHDCLIEKNEISGSKRSESAAGNGIHIWYGNHMLIKDNQISDQRDGIYFEFVKDSKIIGNTSKGNLRYGLHFMFSNNDEYRGNTFSENSSGVAVMYSKDMKMIDNHFEKSWGGAAFGILLKDISASEIKGNVFFGNTVGVYMEGTTRSRIEENQFLSNGWALRVLGDSDQNVFTHNNVISNTFDASTNSSGNLNIFTENYWSSYKGLDMNHDGVGDTPYHPVRLSSMLMERYGVSVLLIKSFFFMIADEAESVFPVITPDALRDDRPLMKRSGSS